MKDCLECNISKSLSDYRKLTKNKDNLDNTCKDCRKEYEREYRKNNNSRIKENSKRYRENNKEHVTTERIKYRKTEHSKRARKNYYIKNRERILASRKIYRDNNKKLLNDRRQTSEYKIKRKVWAKNYYDKSVSVRNRYNALPETKIKRRAWDRLRGQTEERKINRRFHSSQRKIRIKHATPEWLTSNDILSIKNLHSYAYMLNSFDYIDYHVDHIIPIKNDLICGLNVPCNLQILSCTENLRKSNKFDGTRDNKGWMYD